MSIEAEDIHRRWMDKKNYKLNEDEHKFRSCMWRCRCVEKEFEDEEKCKEIVKMNMSCKDALCVKNETY